jgi:hypothetical protein
MQAGSEFMRLLSSASIMPSAFSAGSSETRWKVKKKRRVESFAEHFMGQAWNSIHDIRL